jgi:hypothetical protein
MTLTEQDYILLEDYLDNTLPNEAKATLETRIRSDREFRQSAYEYLTTLKALRAKRNAVLSEKLQAIETANSSSATVVPMRQWWLLLGGVGAAAMLVYFMFFPKENEYEALAQKYFEPLEIERTRASDELKTEANQYYLDKDYKNAAVQFEKVFVYNNKDSTLLLYIGIAHIGTKKFDEAITVLSPLLNSDRTDSDAIRWYLSLAYLGKHDISKTIEYLDKLSEENNNYQEKAIQLKKVLLSKNKK